MFLSLSLPTADTNLLHTVKWFFINDSKIHSFQIGKIYVDLISSVLYLHKKSNQYPKATTCTEKL